MRWFVISELVIEISECREDVKRLSRIKKQAVKGVKLHHLPVFKAWCMMMDSSMWLLLEMFWISKNKSCVHWWVLQLSLGLSCRGKQLFKHIYRQNRVTNQSDEHVFRPGLEAGENSCMHEKNVEIYRWKSTGLVCAKLHPVCLLLHVSPVIAWQPVQVYPTSHNDAALKE